MVSKPRCARHIPSVAAGGDQLSASFRGLARTFGSSQRPAAGYLTVSRTLRKCRRRARGAASVLSGSSAMRLPSRLAYLTRLVCLGSTPPRSRRATLGCLVPSAAATCSWLRPCRSRSEASSSTSLRVSSSALTRSGKSGFITVRLAMKASRSSVLTMTQRAYHIPHDMTTASRVSSGQGSTGRSTQLLARATLSPIDESLLGQVDVTALCLLPLLVEHLECQKDLVEASLPLRRATDRSRYGRRSRPARCRPSDS